MRHLSLRALEMLFSVQLEAVLGAEAAEPFAEPLCGFSRARREQGENSSDQNMRTGPLLFFTFNLIPFVGECWQQKNRCPFEQRFVWHAPGLALGDGGIVALGVTNIHLAWTTDGLVAFAHLFPLGDPAGETTQSEHHREHIGWNADGAVNDA